MEFASVNSVIKKIHIYLGRQTFQPYFVIADGAHEIKELKKNFENLKKIYVSDFCEGDFFLDTDLFIEKLKLLEENSLCFGLGEYIFFTGQENILRKLQDKNFNKKIIFVCRGISNLLERLANEDFKFRANNFCKIGGQWNFSIVKYGANMNIETNAKNFAELLKLIEDGKNNFITVKSELPLQNIKEVNTFYDAIKMRYPHLKIFSSALSEKQWQEYFFDDKCEN